MTHTNSEKASRVNQMVVHSQKDIESSISSVQRQIEFIKDIASESENIRKIIKTIDEIVPDLTFIIERSKLRLPVQEKAAQDFQ